MRITYEREMQAWKIILAKRIEPEVSYDGNGMFLANDPLILWAVRTYVYVMRYEYTFTSLWFIYFNTNVHTTTGYKYMTFNTNWILFTAAKRRTNSHLRFRFTKFCWGGGRWSVRSFGLNSPSVAALKTSSQAESEERAYSRCGVGVEVVLAASFVSETRRSRDGSGPPPSRGCYN